MKISVRLFARRDDFERRDDHRVVRSPSGPHGGGPSIAPTACPLVAASRRGVKRWWRKQKEEPARSHFHEWHGRPVAVPIEGRDARATSAVRWLAALMLLLSITATLSTASEERPLRIVTLNTVLTEIAREVGGDGVVVEGLVRPGVDPHAFEPTAGDVRALMQADLVLASGLQMESYFDRLVAQLETGHHVVVVGDSIPNPLRIADEHAHGASGEKDPHWWHSIDNVLRATDLVRGALSDLRPRFAAIFLRNAQHYSDRLRALKTWAEAEIEQIPREQRQLVTSHEAFGYFARDFGFEIHAISGLSTDGEPNAKHLAGLIDLIRHRRIKAVFAESSVNARVVANLVAETGVRLGGTLYADGLGPLGSDAATYESMYRHNVKTIVHGLK